MGCRAVAPSGPGPPMRIFGPPPFVLTAFGSILGVLDYFGTVVFAASGALLAVRRGMDPVGAVFLAIATAIGGGTLRDLLLGCTPVFWVFNPSYLIVSTLTALIVFALSRFIAVEERFLVWADAIGLATFSVIGTEVAYATGTPMAVALLMGVMTATAGGILRDILSARRPLILASEIYVTAALAGSFAYWLLHAVWGLADLAAATGFLVTFALRAAAILFRIELPKGRPAP